MPDRRKVVLTDYTLPLETEQLKMDIIREKTGAETEIVHKDEDVPKALADAEVAIMHRTRFNEEVLARAPKLKLIVKCGIGVDTIDVPACTKRGIYVVNNPPHCKYEVAEHTLALLFSLARKVAYADRSVRVKPFPKQYDFSFAGVRLYGKTLGMVGLGGIGQVVAQTAKAMGMNVLAYTPRLTQERAAKAGATAVPFAELLQKSDFVVLLLPLTKDNEHMIGDAQLRMMKKNALLINTARGKLVDEKALEAALAEGRIGGVATDVSEREPIAPDHPLLKFDNVVVTPHMGWSSPEAIRDIELIAADQVMQYLRGEVPDHVLNPSVIQK